MARKKSGYFKYDPIYEYNNTLHIYRNKYFNLFRSNFKWTGLDYRQEEYIMKEFYNKGTVAAFLEKGIGELCFAPWTLNEKDMYGNPEKVMLVNQYNSTLIPVGITQIVDKDVVIGYLQPNHKGLVEFVDWYCKRIAEVEMVINTNVQIHKLPFIIPVDEQDKAKVQDIIDKILANEIVIFAEGFDPALFKAITTAPQYIIDKLLNYKRDLENELKTFMGVNNPGQQKIEQLQLAEVNANNQEIMDYEASYIKCLKTFCENIKLVFNKEISVVSTSAGLEVEGIAKTYEDKPGPKDNEESE